MNETMTPHKRWKQVTPKDDRTKPISIHALVEEVTRSANTRYYFSKDTMRFFGDRISNYGIRHAIIDGHDETDVPVWELYRKKPVKMNKQDSAYFRKDNFEVIREKT